MKYSVQVLLPFILIFSLSLFIGKFGVAQNTTKPFNVGVVLNFNKLIGRIGLSSISMALSDFYATHSFYKTRLVFHTRDSKNSVVRAASMALDLLKNIEVQAIIGPQTSSQADFVIDLGDQAHVPIISFSATSPSLSSAQTPYFVRASLSDSSQVKAIASIVQAFRWKEVVLIYENTNYGKGIVPYLVDAFTAIETRVPYRSVLSPSATDDRILSELYKLMTMQTRVFVVHMSYSLAARFFVKTKDVGMMNEGYAWIITNGLSTRLNSMDPPVAHSMQGVLGVAPYVPMSDKLKNFNIRWTQKFHKENTDMERATLNTFGLWAYDTVWALALAAEKVGAENTHFQHPQVVDGLTDLSTLGISTIGPKLLQAILERKFTGLSGEFSLVDGQLQSSVFRILNVIGGGGREIGFWTPRNGILRELNAVDTKIYSSLNSNLGDIVWPGNSTTVPKGWVIPTNGKKLKIGVPVGQEFTEFVKVAIDPTTNAPIVTGYCIDVFNAVIGELAYALPYEFIPFMNSDGTSAGTYNDLIYQIYLQKYDAVVGDVTIRANRSIYVDFTMPFTESGVTMIVPIKEDQRKNRWVFLKPLKWDLWFTTLAFFIFTGFVIWVLEHRVNNDFRGSPINQLGMIFWFVFSTMVFAHKEVFSNLARFVVIIWVFVVLILTSSYTASLTSMLTVQQLQPTVTDVKELIRNGAYVGYKQDSFVFEMLKQMRFNESKIRTYASLEELDEALSKGSDNGGIAAAFDEIPYMKLFLSKYCDKYTMVGPTYKADGFGFAFPKGSPLASDVSRAVLNVTEGVKMSRIEQAWFGQHNCPDLSTKVSSSSLTLDSFGGLFIITGAASLLALFIFLLIFFRNYENIIRRDDPNTFKLKRIVEMAKKYDEMDPSSHDSRVTKNHKKNTGIASSIEASPISIALSPPTSPSVTDRYCNPFGEEDQERASTSSSGMDGNVTPLEGEGSPFSTHPNVDKRSLPDRLDSKVSAVEEAKDLEVLSLDELHGIFTAYEMRKAKCPHKGQMESDDEVEKKISFKGKKKKFFFKSSKKNQFNKRSFISKKSNDTSKEESEDESDDDVDDHAIFMVFEEKEVESPKTCTTSEDEEEGEQADESKKILEDLEEKLSQKTTECTKLELEILSLKAKLEEETNILVEYSDFQKEIDALKAKVAEFENDSSIHDIETSSQVHPSSKKLDEILSSQRSTHNKFGLGFVGESSKSAKGKGKGTAQNPITVKDKRVEKNQTPPHKINHARQQQMAWPDRRVENFDYYYLSQQKAKNVVDHRAQHKWNPFAPLMDVMVECYRCSNYGHIARDCKTVFPPQRPHNIDRQGNVRSVKATKPKRQIPREKQLQKPQSRHRVWVQKSSPEKGNSSMVVQTAFRTQGDSTPWILDSGCSSHMIGDKKRFEKLETYAGGSVKFGNNDGAKIVGKGTISLNNEKMQSQDVLYVEGLKHNLLSISQICDRGHEVVFNSQGCEIRRTSTGKLMATGKRTSGNLYTLTETVKDTCMVSMEEETWLWHRRLGHIRFNSLGKISSKPSNHICGSC
ncbi:glutamate receptor 2.7-like [Telopea speciosissima]|uniref:glutamate receptor 2.7-like n=1 Tax=Telopea speciosissima TaxID=54955 RepID=UPI001CC72565|nr:glutamate receptor 2.7-like [Telopea speciosissima]